jgi:regulatory protein
MARQTRSFPRERPRAALDAAGARGLAIRLLSRRDFASAELHERLKRRGVSEEVALALIAELIEERVLDDTRFVQNFVSYRVARGEGPVRIKAELQALGLPGELIDGAVTGGAEWRALARDVRVRKFGPEPPESWADKARQARFLQYRGFSIDHIRSALDADFDLD